MSDNNTEAATKARLPGYDSGSFWPASYVEEQAYLIARGVRAMALVGTVVNDPDIMLQADTQLSVLSLALDKSIPFVFDRHDGLADCGFAAATWVIDLYCWLHSGVVPDKHRHHIIGLMLGYSADAIRDHDALGSGRRFTWSQ
jgi:hypothetical protein